MAKILVVEDDSAMRSILISILEEESHSVTGVEDGQKAKNVLSLQDFDLVISDVQMPLVDGIELLSWTKSKKEIPFVLMTGFSEVLEAQRAYELGANSFLPKPFTNDDLKAILSECLTTESDPNSDFEEIDQTNPEDFCSVSIEDFVSGEEIPFSIYLKLTETKFVKIAHKGEDISLERIKAYKTKGLHNLYLKREDFCRYVGMTMKIAKALTESKSISQDRKERFLKHAGETLMEKIRVHGVDKKSFDESVGYVKSTLLIVSDHSDIFHMLDNLNDHSDFLFTHALGVSLYGTILAKQLNWNSAPTIFKVSMAGLFHDIGKKEIDLEILKKPRVQLTQSERKTIESHPQRGVELLSYIDGIPDDIILVALQHHECVDGSGFPKGLTKSKIHPLSKLISVANVFCEYAIKGPHSKGMSSQDAIAQMCRFKTDTLDRTFFSALKTALKYEEEQQ